jgi:hypothetical protein
MDRQLVDGINGFRDLYDLYKIRKKEKYRETVVVATLSN